MLPAWKLTEFEFPASGRGAIEDWRKGFPQGPFKASLDTFLKTMVKLEQWGPPQFEPMTGRLAGFHELRWKAGRIQHRIIGELKGNEFVMLVGCTHKDNVYNPPNSLDTALVRAKQLSNGEAKTREYKVLAN